MSQHDMVLDDNNGASFLVDVNSALAAIASGNSGTARPTTCYAGQLWLKTNYGTNLWGLYRIVDPENASLDILERVINTANGAEPYALVSMGTAQSIPPTIGTKHVYDTVVHDADGLWDGVNNRFVFPAAALVEVKVNTRWAPNSTGSRTLTVLKKGVAAPGLPFAMDYITAYMEYPENAAGEVVVAADDYLEVFVSQTSGVDLNIGASSYDWFSVRVIKWL